ncbi:MAG: hypothetical protein ACRELY_25440 [Polyangiaceae bacterium]
MKPSSLLTTFATVAWISVSGSACAVGVATPSGSGTAAEDSGSANDTTGSQSYGDDGSDAAAKTSSDAGKKIDSGSVVVEDSGSSSSGTCASPSTPADCTCASGHTCAANNCYGGYLCDTSTNRCKPASACP